MLHRETPDAPYSPEVSARIALNAQRLREPYYQMPEVFSPVEYDWPGDKEGRALLAFVSHYKMTGEINPCMPALLSELAVRANKDLYLGPDACDVVFEQQLSSHSWLLRGLCEHYEQFLDDFSLKALKSITEGLFLPTKGRYRSYPVDRSAANDGGVSGHSGMMLGGWNLSTDVGCAFMSIDGLSHVYKITRDERVKALLDEMIEVYCAIDKVALKAQTHCTLTAARGMIRMYQVTEDSRYLIGAKDIFDLYAFGKGMDATYQNLNWWGRPDTWTEPCAIVDSLMVAGELYKITRKDSYRRCAARIFHNGFASAQRANGGAGTDTVVVPENGQNDLRMSMYEAPFCCTMRLAEGLWYVKENVDMLYYEIERKENGELWIVHDEYGRYMCGDLVLCEASLPEGVDTQGWEMPAPVAERHGHKLIPLVKFYKTPDSVASQLVQKILFEN